MTTGWRVDPAALFDSGERARDLTVRSARGGAVSFVGQVSKTLVQVGGTVVLARLLTPEEFGLLGMSTVVVGFMQMLKDAGLGSATVQRAEIEESQVSTLFWLTMLINVSVFMMLLLASPVVASFYRRPELGPVTAALAGVFLLGGISAQHEALLRRHMTFKPIVASQLFGQVVNVVASVAAALAGLGYWSLVLGSAVGALVSVAVVFLFCPWVPSRPRRHTGAGRMLTFGSHVFAFNSVNYLARNGDYLLIGKFMGAADLGVYTRAYQIFMQPVSQIIGPLSAAAMPALSALASDPARYRRYYGGMLRTAAILTVPMAVYLGVESDFVVSTLLGGQWMAASPVLRWLSIAAVFQAVTSTLGLVLLSCGRSRRYLGMGITNAIVMVSGIMLGLRYGIVGVAVGYTAANVVYWVPATWLFTRDTPVQARQYWMALAVPVACALPGAAALLMLRGLQLPSNWGHMISLAGFLAIYSLAVFSLDGVRDDARRIIRALRSSGGTT